MPLPLIHRAIAFTETLNERKTGKRREAVVELLDVREHAHGRRAGKGVHAGRELLLYCMRSLSGGRTWRCCNYLAPSKLLRAFRNTTFRSPRSNALVRSQGSGDFAQKRAVLVYESGPGKEPLSDMPPYGDGSTQLVVPPPMLVVAKRAVVDEEPQKTSIPPVLPVTVPGAK